MKLPKIRLRQTYTPLILTVSWFHGMIIGGFIGSMAGAAKWNHQSGDWWAMAVFILLIVFMGALEYGQKRRAAKHMKRLDEAHYMNKLFEGGIDVGSPGFDLVTIDREYRA